MAWSPKRWMFRACRTVPRAGAVCGCPRTRNSSIREPSSSITLRLTFGSAGSRASIGASAAEATTAEAGRAGACAADVRAVVPVVVDRPDVVQRPVQATPVHPGYSPQVSIQQPQSPAHPPTVVEEITNVTTNFAIDARTTIIDQSVNQNIWAGGDVTQIFDQEAIVASGDGSVAAGKDASIDNSQTEIDADDIGIGNTEITAEISDAFNDQSTTTDVDVTVGTAAEDPVADGLVAVVDAPADAALVTDAATATADTATEVLDVPDAGVAAVANEYEDSGAVLYDPAGYDVDGLDQP